MRLLKALVEVLAIARHSLAWTQDDLKQQVGEHSLGTIFMRYWKILITLARWLIQMHFLQVGKGRGLVGNFLC